MATIDRLNTTLTVTRGAGLPTVTADPGPPVGFFFRSTTIDANASMRLTGTVGESVAGWTLGFVQLKYIGTDYARFRGVADRDGSIFITSSNQILCRDTDVGSTEVWYDSVNSGGTTGPNGTNTLAAGTVIPRTGFLDVPAHLFDRPKRWWQSVEKNQSIARHPDNFLYHVGIGLSFCTMLVAQDTGNNFHMLKHVYWNVQFDQMFTVDGSGNVTPGRTILLQHNIQHPVHSGNPMDRRFHGKEYDLTLPVSNTVSRRLPHVLSATDWRHM
jgi:hypothetical protein